jgi:hypothetical protein
MSKSNSPERVEELRRHAAQHQANRDTTRGYSVRVVYWGERGEECETTGYIAAVNLDSIRLAVLNRLGGGFRTLGFRRVTAVGEATS